MSKEEVLQRFNDEVNSEAREGALRYKRQKCIVYTRVMGYHRPVESFNIGKTGEHKQRKQFKEC